MSRLAMFWVVMVGSALAGVGRFTVPGHDLTGWPGLYEAMAHIWCGVLITLGFSKDGQVRLLAWVSLGVITALETVKFLTR